jgi:hypothetical protein
VDEVLQGDDSPESQDPSPSHLSKSSALDEAGISEEDLARGIPLEGLDPHDHKLLLGIDHWQDIQLKKTYAKWLLRLVAAQLVIADAVFVAYAWAGKDWNVEPAVIQFWLGATLVELIGVALVITRYLFPRRDRYGDGASSETD